MRWRAMNSEIVVLNMIEVQRRENWFLNEYLKAQQAS